jgi:thioredoxin-dependent peroxiredoxin
MIDEGQEAPDFELATDDGSTVKLSDLRGKHVVLYFYPKDDTPGCTVQACGIRDAWGEFQRTGAVVFGVSPDDPTSHAKFREKYELPFTLLADEDHSVAEAYGVWVEKSYAGSKDSSSSPTKYWGVERSTFVIGPDGTLEKVMRRVDPSTHADDVLAALPPSSS